MGIAKTAMNNQIIAERILRFRLFRALVYIKYGGAFILKKAKEVDELIKYDITNKRYAFVKDNLDNRKSLYKKLDQVMRHVQYLLSEYHEQKDTKIAFVKLEKDYNLAEKELR